MFRYVYDLSPFDIAHVHLTIITLKREVKLSVSRGCYFLVFYRQNVTLTKVSQFSAIYNTHFYSERRSHFISQYGTYVQPSVIKFRQLFQYLLGAHPRGNDIKISSFPNILRKID
jgi:hypothetical protein